jgi:hypothetical protein
MLRQTPKEAPVVRRSVRLGFLATVVVVLLGLAAYAAATTGDAPDVPADVEAELRQTVLTFAVEKHPVVPEEYYGRVLTLARCTRLLRTHTERIRTVAEGEAVLHGNIGWTYLAGIRQEIRDLSGALPIAWDGEIVYWQVMQFDDEECVVRAAVQMTRTSAYWDERAGELGPPTSRTYSSTPADQYTLERIDGAWKITQVDGWMLYDVPGGLNTAP